jgi:hypothetical protein
VGIHVADRSLFLAIARLLWAFDFAPATDKSGNAVMPDRGDSTAGFVVSPNRFPLKITPRSEARAKVARGARDECRELLDGRGQWREMPAGMAFVGQEDMKARE